MNPVGPQTTSSDWVYRLASLVHAIRHDWDEPGVASALRKVADRPLATVARAAIACAIERTDQRTPAVIALDGDHWPKATATRTYTEPGIVTYCEHGEPGMRCLECYPRRTPTGTGPTPEQRAQMRAGIEAGRQATHDLARPHQPNTQEDQA